jgi:hypothetical protein
MTATLSDIQNVEYLQLEIEYNLKVADTNTAQAAVDFATVDYAADPTESNLDIFNEKMALLGEAVIEEAKAREPFDAVKAKILALQKRIARMESVNVEPAPVQIWCTDLSDGLKFRGIFDADDEAGTIELVGDVNKGQTLQPHYADLGLYSTDRDGLLTPTAALTPASYYYNRAMMTGWQKWRDEYRPGIITGVSGGLGGFDITLDDIRSKEQADFIPVNDFEDGLLTNVPAVYMNCNESAFSVDDHVIVKTEWVGALRDDTVVGFVDNPKSCDINGFNYHPYVFGGTTPGWQDWQNVQPLWVMKTPVLTDFIADGAGSGQMDWKGFLNDDTKILAQWGYGDQYIYIDGVKLAVTPAFNLSGATGDPIAIAVMTGIATAWVTKDKQYIYAVCRENGSSRHVFRKTIEIELTGVAYHVTTDPDGWESTAAFGPSSFTDFNTYGRLYMNESGTEGRSMDSWDHGAKRTPQQSAGAGATWLALSEYNDNWNEESQVSIATPSAASLAAAGVAYQFNGLVGAGVFRSEDGSDVITYSNGNPLTFQYETGVRAISSTKTVSGTYAVSVGYDGDTVTYLRINGTGSSVYALDSSWTTADPSGEETKTTTVTNFGAVYESDADGWVIPLQVEDDTRSASWSYPGTTGDNCERLDGLSSFYNTTYRGNFESINVSDGIFVYYTDEDYLSWVTTYGGDPCVTGNAPGTRDITTIVTERGSVLLGTNQQDFERVPVDTFTSDSILITPPGLSFPGSFTFNPGDPDPYVWLSTTSSDVYNLTGYDWPFGVHSEKFVQAGGARDHNGKYIFSAWHQYNLAETSEYWSFLTGGDLSALDELDNGTGTVYYWPHVAN